MSSTISTKSLRIDYDTVTAVDDLNLQINSGQIFGLVGPNGAGKTSTLKALAGLVEPTYGEIKIHGYDLELEPQKALQLIGFMPDFPPVYENLKVWEYLDVFAAAYHISKNERRKKAKFWIEEVNLTEKWDSFVHQLSRGMRQRLVLAKTLIHDPQILLLDEPASGLDPVARRDFRTILKKAAQAPKTIIISSHILTELSDFCDSIGIMEKGRIVVSGTIEEIRKKLGSRGQLFITIASDNRSILEKFHTLMKNSSEVIELKENAAGVYQSEFSGTKEDAAILLTKLVKENIPVAGFHIKEEDVEDIFFKIGAKEVS